LVAADVGFGGAEPAEELENFAVLEDAGAASGRGQQFNSPGDDAVTMKNVRRAGQKALPVPSG